MLRHCGGRWPMVISTSPTLLPLLNGDSTTPNTFLCKKSSFEKLLFVRSNDLNRAACCRATRRSVRYEEDDDDDDGHNEEIAVLELYSERARGEALIVKALLDEEQVEVLIFKGMSSSLTYGTSPDPSKSIISARAVITSVDRIKGPFDPSNIEYIEKGLAWDAFENRL